MTDATQTTSSLTPPCPYCGSRHLAKCPSVKAITYHQDGTVAHVEFFAPVDYPPMRAETLPMCRQCGTLPATSECMSALCPRRTKTYYGGQS
jgi:hypothetical protein